MAGGSEGLLRLLMLLGAIGAPPSASPNPAAGAAGNHIAKAAPQPAPGTRKATPETAPAIAATSPPTSRTARGKPFVRSPE